MPTPKESIFNKKVLWITLFNLVWTFALAILWHLIIFGSVYESLNYMNQEPIFALGFAAIATQSYIFAVAYYWVQSRPWLFSFLFMAVIWSSHVLAYSAKVSMTNIPLYMALETAYFIVNYSVIAWFVTRIYSQK